MHRLDDHRELLDRSGGDPWVRWSVPDPLQGEVWVHEDVALVERVGRRRGFWVAPLREGMRQPTSPVDLAEESGRVRAALTKLRADGHLARLSSQSVSVVQEHAAAAHEALELGDGGDWDWMWAQAQPPVHPLEPRVVLMDDRRDAEELTEFTTVHNPRVWTEIGTGRVRRWVGLRGEGGALVAIGGAEMEASGVPHLAGIVTDAALRGQGLGTAVSAHLTRWSIDEYGVCTLGMFSDNTSARHVYRALGYRTARAWHSRSLA